MNWREILHNRRLQLAAAAAAAAGLFVFMRRRSSGGTAGNAGTPAGASSSGGIPQSFDSSGTDLAAFLGQLGVSQQQTLTDFAQTITERLDQLGARIPDPNGNTPPPTPNNPPPATNPPPASQPFTWTVLKGQTLSYIANYLKSGRPGVTWSGTWQDIYNANRGLIGSNPNLIKPGQVLVIPNPPPY